MHAPTLVCLPGAMCAPQVYLESARRSGLNAVALGWLEGDGPHDLDTIAERVSAAIVDLPAVILVGHSLGTPIAMLSALRESAAGTGRVRGMVLANSGANTHGHGDIEGLIERIRSQWGEAFWDAFVTRCFHTRPQPPLLAQVLDYPARLSNTAVVEALRGQHAKDFVPLLPTLPRVPVAIVHGRHDPARTLGHAQQMADGIADASLHVLETGHTSCAEDPDAFAAVLRAVAARCTNAIKPAASGIRH